MIEFTQKSLSRSKTLGDRLRQVREDSSLTLADAAAGTQIKQEYLNALESGDYGRLPGPVYIESFLKKYAEWLQVSSEFVLSVYRQQEKKMHRRKFRPTFSFTSREHLREIITPRLLRNIIIGIIGTACLVYIGWSLAKIFTPPPLEISQPADYLQTTQGSVKIMGLTTPEAELTINGKEIFLEENGSFTETVFLKEGINEIVVTAKRERSNAVSVIRHVSFEQ